MIYTTLSNFSSEEEIINDQLNYLFSQWDKALDEKKFWEKYNREYFVTDGIFPGYLAQPQKILFMGREVLDIAGLNYIDVFFRAIKENSVGNRNLNQHAFYRRLLKISFGLLHNCIPWKNIPLASEIADTFGEVNGTSFAFMNVSKLSHQYDDINSWQADYSTIEQFLKESSCPHNFFSEQIQIIDPEIIITMNIENYYQYLGSINYYASIPDLNIYYMKLEKRIIPIFNTWHFSAIKSDYDRFYGPLCEGLKKWKTTDISPL